MTLKTDLTLLAPELFLAGAAMFLLLYGAFRGNAATGSVMVLSVIVLGATVTELWTNDLYQVRTVFFGGFLVTDTFAVAIKTMCLMGLALCLLISKSALRSDGIARFEYPVLALLSGTGMMLMASSNDFLAAYMALELSSLALYVLAAFRRDHLLSAEAGMKYFVLGALSSGMMLFGISLIYGYGGTTNFDQLHFYLVSQEVAPPGVMIGMAFVLAGLAFKISAVPFHMWTPDVYQGAPGPVTAMFAVVPKVAALALLIRVLFHPFGTMMIDWAQIITFLAVASMLWAAIAAVRQTNIKRLLAYGSILNIGYALIGVVVATPEALAATFTYIAIYMLMTAGVFAVLLAIRRDGVMIEEINDFSGLSRRSPIAAYTIAVMMFAFAGLPPLAGFIGKLLVFNAAVEAELYALAIIGVLASVVAAYYYLNVIKVMFFNSPNEDIEVQFDGGQQLAILGTLFFVLLFVFAPAGLYEWMLHATASLFPVVAAP